MKKFMSRQQYTVDGRLIIEQLDGDYDPKDSEIFKEVNQGLTRWFRSAWVFDTPQEVLKHVNEGLQMDLEHVKRELQHAQLCFDAVDRRRKKIEAGEFEIR